MIETQVKHGAHFRLSKADLFKTRCSFYKIVELGQNKLSSEHVANSNVVNLNEANSNVVNSNVVN